MSPGRDPHLLGYICSVDKTHSSTQSCLVSFVYHLWVTGVFHSKNDLTWLYQEVIQPSSHRSSHKWIPKEV